MSLSVVTNSGKRKINDTNHEPHMKSIQQSERKINVLLQLCRRYYKIAMAIISSFNIIIAYNLAYNTIIRTQIKITNYFQTLTVRRYFPRQCLGLDSSHTPQLWQHYFCYVRMNKDTYVRCLLSHHVLQSLVLNLISTIISLV